MHEVILSNESFETWSNKNLNIISEKQKFLIEKEKKQLLIDLKSGYIERRMIDLVKDVKYNDLKNALIIIANNLVSKNKEQNTANNFINSPNFIKHIMKKAFQMACFTLYPNLNKNILTTITGEMGTEEFYCKILQFKDRIINPLKIDESGFILESDQYKHSMSHFWGWYNKYIVVNLKTALKLENHLIFIGDTRTGIVDHELMTNDKIKTLNESPFYTFLIERT